MDWEEIFANATADKGLISKYTKSLYTSIPKKDIQRNQKMGRIQGRHTDGQYTHEKMLNIASYHRNGNPRYTEVSPHTSQNGHH